MTIFYTYMKNLFLVIFCISSHIACVTKKDTLRSIPVLMGYKLHYPNEALERGLEGRVIMRVLITEDGKAEHVQIHQSSGEPLLDSAAVRTAQTFVFSPAMLNNKPIQSSVILPVEFILEDIDFETWITQVRILQDRIERSYSKEAIEELYNLYNRLIYSMRNEKSLDLNDYIKEAVLDSAARLWEGYWTSYQASTILFIDVILRYPDSFVSLKAKADFDKFFKEEAIKIRHALPSPQADTIIKRIYNAVDM